MAGPSLGATESRPVHAQSATPGSNDTKSQERKFEARPIDSRASQQRNGITMDMTDFSDIENEPWLGDKVEATLRRPLQKSRPRVNEPRYNRV